MSTTTRSPSSFRVQEAVTLLVQARDLLLADEALAADQDLMADYLGSDPATCDSMDVVHALVRAIISTEDMAKAAKERAAEINARGARFKARADGMRNTLKTVMQLLEVKRLIQQDFGASLGMGKGRIIVTGELADEFVKIERAPSLTEIGRAMDAGVEVENAVRSNPEPTVTIRRQ
jgi:Siphovirus Gp157